MEQSPSSNRRMAKWMLFAACVVLGTGLLCAVAFYKTWLGRRTTGMSATVRPSVEAVLRAQLWSRVSGGYWENEMEAKALFVSTLPERDRLDFFRAILLTCELDTSRATLFSELVGKDAESLRRDLRGLKDSAEFGRLSAKQQKEVVAWIDELKVVAELHSASLLK
jgi:hypothetical protein